MTEPIQKEFKILITMDPATNSFTSTFQPPPGASPDFVWEALKVCVIAMTKSAPYFPDPVVRDTADTAAKAMKLIALGADAQLQKAQQQRAAINKELQ